MVKRTVPLISLCPHRLHVCDKCYTDGGRGQGYTALGEKLERAGYSAAKAMAPSVRETYEKDWMDDANCVVELEADVRFFTKPDDPAPLERICKQCPVSMQCMEWADKHNPTGVFIAGEWRQ